MLNRITSAGTKADSDMKLSAYSSASIEANPMLCVRAFLRKYRVQWSEKWKANEAVPMSDTLLGEYDCPSKAYSKTQRHIKRDFDKGIVQDVWFQCVFENKIEQLKLF